MIGDDFYSSPPARALAARGRTDNVCGDYAQDSPPAEIARADEASRTAVLSELRPGPASPADPKRVSLYDDNAWAVSEGQRWFQAFNCNGCHANGGGGMGPALMDDVWIYGFGPENIRATIIEGRPNGMPSFRGRLTEQQAWELVAYVRSLGGLLRKDVEPGRSDSMNARLAPQSTPPQKPRQSE